MSEQARHVPYDIEVEQAILGSCILDNSGIDTVSEILDPEQFYDPLHQRIFEMVLQLATEGPVAPLVLHSVMKTDPGMIEVGGRAYLIDLVQAAPAIPNLRELALITKDLFDRRALIQFGEDLVDAAYENPVKNRTADLTERAITGIDAITAGSRQRKSRRPRRAADTVHVLLRKIEQQAVAEKPIGVKTGLSRIDHLLGGLMPGKLIVAGGRPGMGKSILATNIGRHVAEQGVPCDYLSGEMDDDELSARIGCEIDYDRCAADHLKPLVYQDFVHLRATGEMIGRMAEANLRLHDWPFDIVDVSNMTLEWIESYSRRRARQHPGHRVLIIDHLQLVSVETLRKGGNRTEEQTIITKALKSLAKDLGWTILLLSQLNRSVEDREDKHPRMQDFREGGSIEQDADAVIGLMRPLRYASQRIKEAKNTEQRDAAIVAYDDAKGVLEMALLKNRSGPEADYFNVFVDEKSSVIRDKIADGESAEQMLF